MECMLTYGWPGNIRELRNVVRTALALSPDGTLRLEQLPWTLRGGITAGQQARQPAMSLGISSHLPSQADASAVDDDPQAKTEIMALLQRHRWNVSHAAESLDVSRNTLYRRMHRLGILTPRAK